jgi:glutamate-5-semialdehyde dehydrogenase
LWEKEVGNPEFFLSLAALIMCNMENMHQTVIQQLQHCREASRQLIRLPDVQRSRLTLAIADAIWQHQESILSANAQDLDAMDVSHPLYDRLQLTPDRLIAITDATRQVSKLPDPVGRMLSQYAHPNGLRIDRITVPLGVVAAIYEARPNVTVDIAALCLRSGNAVALKGGSDARHSNQCLVDIMQGVLIKAGLPPDIITLLPPDREAVLPLLTATRYVDVLIPRGSQGLIDYVRQHATVPTIETGAGVCHTYVHNAANQQKAADIVVNAKTQRPSVCNALDTVLVDVGIAHTFLPLLIPDFSPFSVVIHADPASHEVLAAAGYPHLKTATAESFGREYLSQQCSIKTVRGLTDALNHIAQHSSRHSEAIITEDAAVADIFLQSVDAAAVYHNASTRFTDGGAFGLGAELGISTQKLHARGPFALEKLVCEKWVVRGEGQVR